MVKISDIVDRYKVMPLSEATAYLGISEERAVQLARQGRVVATEEQDGWRFDTRSTVAYGSEQTLSKVSEITGQYSEDLVGLLESTVELQFMRGRIVGMLDMAERIAEELDEFIEERFGS